MGSASWNSGTEVQRLRCTLVGFLNLCINTGALPEIYMGFAAKWWEGFAAAMAAVYPGTRDSKRAATRFLHIVRALCLRHVVHVLWEDPDLAVTSGKFEYMDAMKVCACARRPRRYRLRSRSRAPAPARPRRPSHTSGSAKRCVSPRAAGVSGTSST